MKLKEKIEAEYNHFINNLEQVLTKIETLEGENGELRKIQKHLSDVIIERHQLTQLASKETIESTVWDRLVIAFFGETNAGKSTIIESFRIKFNDLSREQALIEHGCYEDGLIVGDGSSDFTKSYNEYNLSINNRPFTLIDVPGIEGEESEFKDEIKRALNKAHIVFYVQGHNKQPDTATVEKIKKYLKDWVNVYSIYNVRGGSGNYDEANERETLASENVLNTETLIANVFRQTLGDNYKGNITIQGLLNLCSLANFSEKREKLIRTQNKLITHFGSRDNIYDFARFEDVVQVVDDKSVNFMTEIVEANKQKMTFLARESYNAIENELKMQGQNIQNLRGALSQFYKDVEAAIRIAQMNINRDVKYAINAAFAAFKSQIFAIIDADGDDLVNRLAGLAVVNCAKLDPKIRTQMAIDNLEKQLSKDLESRVKRAISNNLKSTKDKIAAKRRTLDSFAFNLKTKKETTINVPTINSADFLSELDLKLKDVTSFVMDAASGALAGMFFGGIGAAVGAVVGGALFFVKRMLSGGANKAKAKAKEEASKQIDKARNEAINSMDDLLQGVKSQLTNEKEAIHQRVNQEIDRLDKTEKLVESSQRKMAAFINNLKNKEYGII